MGGKGSGGRRQDPMARAQQRIKQMPNGCIEWTKGKSGEGYGVISINGKQVYVHRFFYEQYVGPIPEGMKVLHSCDNPPCVNPKHLRTGTDAENVADRVIRGRSKSPGPRKLTEEQVRSIHERRASGAAVAILVKEFEVSRATIYHILQGRTRTHLHPCISVC